MIARQKRLYLKLQKAAHRIQKASDRELASAVKLTTQQAAVLSVINNRVGNSQKAVAISLGLNESAVTPMVRRLMNYGYIKKTRIASDGRAYALELTKDGIEALIASRAPFAKVNKIISQTLSDTEINNLADMLDRLDTSFSEGEN